MSVVPPSEFRIGAKTRLVQPPDGFDDGCLYA